MKRTRGFTLIELLVVLAIVSLLLTLALPRYFASLEMSKERVLAENLRVTRDAIDKYYADRGRYPDSLDELVSLCYLRALPFDPIVESDQHWTVSPPDNGLPGSVANVHSTALGNGPDGRAWNAL